jgi:hypothetical protein
MWRAECEIPTCLGYSGRVNLLLIWGKGWVKLATLTSSYVIRSLMSLILGFRAGI